MGHDRASGLQPMLRLVARGRPQIPPLLIWLWQMSFGAASIAECKVSHASNQESPQNSSQCDREPTQHHYARPYRLVESIVRCDKADTESTKKLDRCRRYCDDASLLRFEDGHESFLWDVNGADAFHPLLTFFLFLQELALTSYVTAVTLGRDVLA